MGTSLKGAVPYGMEITFATSGDLPCMLLLSFICAKLRNGSYDNDYSIETLSFSNPFVTKDI